MIKKDNVTFRAFEGDYEPAELYAGGNKAAGYVSESAQGQELELSNTYNDSYEDLKVFGKSEQKAKWYQAERAIEAGSYQVSAESGIYEVTISDDLIDTDEANKDRICFDSVSGIGYRENMRNDVKTRTALTFTKVESSTLPVLPWTAYGKQLIPFEPYTTNGTGSTTKDWPAPPFVLRETYYFGGGVCDDATAINSNNSAFIILKDGVQVYNKSPNRAITITEDLLGADTVRLYTNSSLVGKTVTQFTGELGSSYSGSYEPFNPTPPEALTVSPDYPQQIYDLKDVTVTSRGRNLFDKSWINNIGSGRNEYHEGNGVYSMNYPSYYAVKSCINDPFPKIEAGSYILSFYCMIQTNTQNKKEVMVGIREEPLGAYLNTARYFTLNENEVWEKVTVPFSVTEESKYALCIQPSGVKDYSATVYFKNIQIVEGTYTADTLPPFDKYRCTSATISVVSSAFEISKTLYDTLPNGYGRYTEDGKYYVCDFVKMENGAVKYVSCIADDLVDGTLSFGTDGNNRFFRGGYPYTLAKDSVVYCTSTHLPGITHAEAYYNQKAGVSKMNGTISVTKQGIFADMTAADFNSWLVLQNSLGTPFTVRNIRQNPVVTNITDTWAQDLLAIKTAPYYTKLFADKDTGGIEATYKHF